jgi:hypothetical protein
MKYEMELFILLECALRLKYIIATLGYRVYIIRGLVYIST